MTREEILIRAATKLKHVADDLRASHTVAGGEWYLQDPADHQAKADHDECMQLAGALLAMGRGA